MKLYNAAAIALILGIITFHITTTMMISRSKLLPTDTIESIRESFLDIVDPMQEPQRQSVYRSLKKMRVEVEEIRSESQPEIPGKVIARSSVDPGRIYMITIPLPDMNSRFFWLAMSLTLFFTITPVMYVIWWMTSPLPALARAMERFGSNEGEPPCLPEERRGSKEVKTIIGAFRRMVSNIQRLSERDRILTHAITHELATPIMSLRWAYELFRIEKSEEKARQMGVLIGNIEDAIHEMDAIIASVHSDRKPDSRNLDLVSFLFSLSKGMGPLLSIYDRTIRIEVGELREIPVVGDPESLSVILKNLIRNAMQHGKEQEILLIASYAQGIPTVRMKARLSGKRDEIFRSFHPGKPPGESRQAGKGLGLVLSQKLAERIGWRLDYDAATESLILTMKGES